MDGLAICLPKGDNLDFVAGLLREAGFPLEGYASDNRTYRPAVHGLPVRAKMFAEKNVVTQVAFGNYALGFTGLDWVEEYFARFPRSNVEVLRVYPGGRKKLVACCHESAGVSTLEGLARRHRSVRIVSEYPHLAEKFAIRNRLRRYYSYPAWGRVENYAPEHAEVVVMAVEDESALPPLGLRPLKVILESSVALIAERRAFEGRDLSPVLEYFVKGEGR